MRHFQALLLAAGLSITAAIAEARQAAQPPPATPSAPQRPSPLPASPQQSSPQLVLPDSGNAHETRERLREVLSRYPPSVGRVLRIDPTLLTRRDYLATYPVLDAFLQQHPEVAHNPSFFIGDAQFAEQNTNPQLELARTLRQSVEFGAIILIVITITSGIVFLVKTIVEHRRWQRAMKAQVDLNTKLIDRFAGSDELLAYLQSPQGKALTGAPALPQAARAMDAPLSRIFWSLQAGAVLGSGGVGLLWVGSRLRDDYAFVAPTFLAFGAVVLAIGAGFLISAVVSFLLSQRLGLVRSISVPVGREAEGS